MKYCDISAKAANSGNAIKVEPAMISPAQVERPDHRGQAHRQRLVGVAPDHYQREGIIRPRQQEREDRHRNQAGQRQRQHHAQKSAEPGAAIDHRGFLQFKRHALEETPQEPDAERQSESQMRGDQAGQRVAEAQPCENRKDRDRDQQRREHVGVQHRADDHLLPANALPRHRIGDHH